jgi:metal-responsive CopG/Arc/MetJ family transcriptional regulator
MLGEIRYNARPIKHSKRIHVTVEEQLLKALDQAAGEALVMRSEYIRAAIRLQLNQEDYRRAKLQSVVEHIAPSNEEALYKIMRLKKLYRAHVRRKKSWRS